MLVVEEDVIEWGEVVGGDVVGGELEEELVVLVVLVEGKTKDDELEESTLDDVEVEEVLVLVGAKVEDVEVEESSFDDVVEENGDDEEVSDEEEL